jgi:hypothetical protein
MGENQDEVLKWRFGMKVNESIILHDIIPTAKISK